MPDERPLGSDASLQTERAFPRSCRSAQRENATLNSGAQTANLQNTYCGNRQKETRLERRRQEEHLRTRPARPALNGTHAAGT